MFHLLRYSASPLAACSLLVTLRDGTHEVTYGYDGKKTHRYETTFCGRGPVHLRNLKMSPTLVNLFDGRWMSLNARD